MTTAAVLLYYSQTCKNVLRMKDFGLWNVMPALEQAKEGYHLITKTKEMLKYEKFMILMI